MKYEPKNEVDGWGRMLLERCQKPRKHVIANLERIGASLCSVETADSTVYMFMHFITYLHSTYWTIYVSKDVSSLWQSDFLPQLSLDSFGIGLCVRRLEEMICAAVVCSYTRRFNNMDGCFVLTFSHERRSIAIRGWVECLGNSFNLISIAYQEHLEVTHPTRRLDSPWAEVAHRYGSMMDFHRGGRRCAV